MPLEVDPDGAEAQLSELLSRCGPEVSVLGATVTVELPTEADAADLAVLLEAVGVEPGGVGLRAAKAAYLAAEYGDCVPWGDASLEVRRYWLRAARAALRLVREP